MAVLGQAFWDNSKKINGQVFQEDKWSSTVLTSQKKVYFGKGGLKLKTPLRNLETKGCLPTFDPSIGS